MAEGEVKVCIGNYGYYNEGQLRDKWITLPKTDKEIQDFLHNNGLMDAMHEEIYISDYDGCPFGIEYGNIFNEYTSLDDLNLLAKQIELMDSEQYERLEEMFSCILDMPDSIVGLMNWIEQENEIPYYAYNFDGITYCQDESPEKKMGRTIAEEGGLTAGLEEMNVEQYFDFEAYGRERSISCTLGDNGYIDGDQDMPAEDWYTREELEESINDEWMCSVSPVRTATEEQLDELVKDTGCENWPLRAEVAEKGRPKDLDILVSDSIPQVRETVAEQGRPQDLDKLVHDGDPFVRATVARNGRPQDLDVLVKDSNWQVRREVAKQGRPCDLDILVNDEDTDVRAMAEKKQQEQSPTLASRGTTAKETSALSGMDDEKRENKVQER